MSMNILSSCPAMIAITPLRGKAGVSSAPD
jgi:hypothetical protein